MYGDFLKSRDEGEAQQQASAEPPPTAKKRHVFGKSQVRVEPLRIDQMLPELTQLMNTAKKERRSHEPSLARHDGSGWTHSNNTIPETLNSSRERNIPFTVDGNHRDTSIDGIRLMDGTPAKSTPLNRPSDSVVNNRDKENFFTPQKISESPAVSNLAQSRHPLAALPLDHAAGKESVGDPDHVDAARATQKSVDSFRSNAHSDAQKRLFGSLRKADTGNYDSEGFRTPQCKINSNDQSHFPKSVSSVRHRLYGTSSSKILALQSNIPLHPAVAAGQQHAKQQLQLQQQAVEQVAKQLYKPQQCVAQSAQTAEVGSSNESSSLRPYQSTGTSLRQTPLASQVALSSEGLCEKPSSSRRLEVHSKDSFAPLMNVEKPQQSSVHSKDSFVPLMNVEKPQQSSVHSKDSFVPLMNVEKSQQSSVLASTNQQPSLHNGPHQLPRRLENPDRSSDPEPLPTPRGELKPLTYQTPVGVSTSTGKAEVRIPAPSNQGANASGAHVLPDQGVKVSDKEVVRQQEPIAADPRKSARTPYAGQIVVNGNTYNILSLLGHGGSSKVYQVLDPVSGQLKAVKCVSLTETDESICQGYLNEIKLLADLQDGDCVIRMFDHEHQVQKNMLLVVMEKGDTDLSKLIKDVTKCKKISAAMIVYYWTEMLNAVSFIHKHGVIHSDLKPANFLLVSGRLKLIDFGIASSVQDDMTSVVKDSLTGTYNYISPEALCSTSRDGQKYKIGYKSDVWSLGCILYNLVYGRTPFQHIMGQFQKLNAIVNNSHKISFPEPPIEGCPSALIHAMKICLVRNPKERASVDELLQLPYLDQASPERVILSQVASLVASVGMFQESEDNRLATVVRAIQRLFIENEKNLPCLRPQNSRPADSS